MKRILLAAIVLMMGATIGWADEKPKPDERTFEITPAAPPIPALKYQLRFDDFGDRRPGNAAILYLDSILLMGPDAKEQSEKALKAYGENDLAQFRQLAQSLELPNVFEELDLAGRRTTCDWDPPFRDVGAYTLLPHLEPLAHAMTRLIKIRALTQLDQGKTDEAVKTLRLGYEMSDKVGQEGILISGLVALHIGTEMDDALIRVMNQPQAPNLFWALSELPHRRDLFHKAMEGERHWWVTSYPNLVKSRAGENFAIMAKAGESLTGEQWRAMLNYVWKLVDAADAGKEKKPRPDPVNDAGPGTLEKAREHYAQTHKVPPSDAAKADPMVVVGEFYFWQYQIAFDNTYKLRGLPYPELLAETAKATATARQLREEQPANPFLTDIDFGKIVWSFARADRELAALSAVEAIRAYAAAHGNRLPPKLEDVTDTPVPENPASGKPFEYRVEKDTAILSDTQSGEHLTCTIKIRK
jgi:hypothetical protein